MEVFNEKKNGITCLRVEGRLDAGAAPVFEKALISAIKEDSSKLIVNLSELAYISSAGLRALLVGAKEIKSKGGKMILACPNESVKKVFDISGFSSIFDLQDSIDAAIKKF